MGKAGNDGLDHDPNRDECKAFKEELAAIQRTGRNHGLDEGSTLILINWLYKRGMVWETIPYGEMDDVKRFVANNHAQIREAINMSRNNNK
jgi:hypothetical protein